MIRYLRRHFKDSLLLLLIVLVVVVTVAQSGAVVVLPPHTEASTPDLEKVRFEEKGRNAQDRVITKRPAVLFAQRPVERPIEEGVIESHDIAEETSSDSMGVPLGIDRKPSKTIPTSTKTQQVAPASKPENVTPKIIVEKPSVEEPTVEKPEKAKTQISAPVLSKPEGKPYLNVPVKLKPPAKKAIKAAPKKQPVATKSTVVETKPVPAKPELPAKKAVKAAPKKQPTATPAKKSFVKAPAKPDLVKSSPEKKPSETAGSVVATDQATAKTAKDETGKYNGPIEVRIKRLFGFDAQLSGTLLGWVDQIYIDELNDEIYLLDKKSKRIVVTNLLGGYLFHFNYVLAGVKNPIAFTVDSLSGEIYLSDTNRIAILNYRGEYQGDFNLSQMPGSKNMFIQSLRLVKTDEGDFLYIGDNKNRRIVVFTTGGKYVRTIGGDRWVGNNIKGLYINKDTIFWLDSTGFSVKSVGLDGKNQRSFGRLSSLLGGFSMPSNLAIDDVNKRIIVVDSNRMMVIFFDFDGNTLFEFGGPRLFSWPRAIAVDKNGYVFVADNSGIIRVFNVVPLDVPLDK